MNTTHTLTATSPQAPRLDTRERDRTIDCLFKKLTRTPEGRALTSHAEMWGVLRMVEPFIQKHERWPTPREINAMARDQHKMMKPIIAIAWGHSDASEMCKLVAHSILAAIGLANRLAEEDREEAEDIDLMGGDRAA